jgi:hypothetical protein
MGRLRQPHCSKRGETVDDGMTGRSGALDEHDGPEQGQRTGSGMDSPSAGVNSSGSRSLSIVPWLIGAVEGLP